MKQPAIIFEDDGLLVLNKPAGLLMHTHPGSTEKTLVDWLLKKYPSIKNVGEPVSASSTTYNLQPTTLRSGIVHRLDKDTSGVLLVAKTQEMYLFLKRQFSSGDAEVGYDKRPKKVYQALVYGSVKDDQGMINRPIGRSRTNPKLRMVGKKATGNVREALTYYKVLERFTLPAVLEARLPNASGSLASRTPGDSFTFLEAYPKTGRTHQVRVHLGSMGKPVLCDALYAPGKVCPLGLARHALHAASIEIVMPGGERRRFSASLPEDMANALKLLKSTKHKAQKPNKLTKK